MRLEVLNNTMKILERTGYNELECTTIGLFVMLILGVMKLAFMSLR